MSTDNQSSVDLDTLLDASLDDLADLPEFKPFAPGVHEVVGKFETKIINDHPSVEFHMTMVKTIELASPTDAVPEANATSSVVFMLDNEIGQGKLKDLVRPLAAHLGIEMGQKGALRTIIEKGTGMNFKIVTKVRKGKEEGQLYMDVKSLEVA